MESLGDIFSLRLLGMGRWVFFCSPETVRQVFKAPAGTLCAGAIHSRMLAPLFGANATFNLDGEPHKHRQRIIMPLLNGDAPFEHVEVIRNRTEKTLLAHRNRGSVSLLKLCHRLSLEILVEVSLGGSASADQKATFALDYENYTNLAARSPLTQFPAFRVDLGPWSPWGKVKRLRKRIRSSLRTAIETAKVRLLEKSKQPCSIVEHLVAEMNRCPRDLPPEGIIDELMNLLFAGHETTGTVLTWCLATVLQHPEVRDTIVRELDQVVGTNPVAAEHLADLQYLEATINESIRINPIGPFSAFRQVMKDWQVESKGSIYHVPAGNIIAHSFPVMSLREDLFPDAKAFKPERFIDQSPNPYHWNPFGGGGRICSGQGLAMVELKTSMATILRNFEIGILVPSIHRVRSGHFLAPKDGLPVSIT